MTQAEIGVFGGSGFYSFLDDVEEVEVDTPYGAPSAPIVIGDIGGTRVAFLPRHGRGARAAAGSRSRTARTSGRCASSACAGSSGRAPRARCSRELELGSFVVCDQFVDRTSGPGRHVLRRARRPCTSRPPTRTAPTCGAMLVETAGELGIPVRDGGTVVVIQGPRFSTRAESRWFQSMGWDVINMTAYPEAILARELELCYANISMVTDHDVGVEGVEPVLARRR